MARTMSAARSFAHPIHAMLLGFPLALYSSALLSDITYLNTAVIQWTNFSSWLLAGANLFAGIVLAWAVIGLLFGRARGARGRGLVYLALVVLTGLVNSFQHARDGWHSVGTLGVTLSALATLFAFAAAWTAFSGYVSKGNKA